jgi:hypothetical protein
MSGGVLTDAEFLETLSILSRQEISRYYYFKMDPTIAKKIDWYQNRPMLRRVYREQGYPRGRNQGAFKQWALTKGRYG